MITNLVNRWSETIAIKIPTTSKADKYNQYSYSDSTISGRLIQSEEEVIIDNGEKVIAKAKLFTSSNLTIDTKIGNYKIFFKKPCKNKSNVIKFYKYFLK